MNLGYDRDAFYYFIDRFLVILDEVKRENLAIDGYLFPLLCFDEEGKDVVIRGVPIKECTLDFLYDFLHEEMFRRDDEPLLIAMPVNVLNNDEKYKMLYFDGATLEGEKIIDSIRDAVCNYIENFSKKAKKKRR
jgi:hypothetical protein